MSNIVVVDAKRESGKGYYPSIERLRIILMFLMCINLYGLPTAYGEWIQTVCGFVPLAFYIISGFLVLREGEDRSQRIVRAIKRTAIAFGILAVAYFIMNFFYYRLLGINIFTAFLSKRVWFNFLILNVWQFDIGSAIWYVQALLYAYIIIYFLDKLKWLRFDWIIAAVLMVFTVITGELAGAVRWEILGYRYVAGNFLTRALPYILIGAFVRRKPVVLGNIKKIWYILGILFGIVLTVLEPLFLGRLGVPGYYGHLIGMGVTAFFVCMLAFKNNKLELGFEMFLALPRWGINCIYYFCQPVSVGVAFFVSAFEKHYFNSIVGYMGIIAFAVSFILAWIVSRIKGLFTKSND